MAIKEIPDLIKVVKSFSDRTVATSFPGRRIHGRKFSRSSPGCRDTVDSVSYCSERGLYLVSGADAVERRCALSNQLDKDYSDDFQRLRTFYGFKPVSDSLVKVCVWELEHLVGASIDAHLAFVKELAQGNRLSLGDQRVLDFEAYADGAKRSFYITRNKEEALSVPRTVYLFGTDLRIPIDSYRSHFVSVSVFQKMAGQNARYIDSKKRDAGVFGFPEIKGIVSRNTRDEIKTMELRPGGLGGGGSFYIVDANVYFNDVGWACGVEASAPKNLHRK